MSKIIETNEKYGNLVRTIFSVLITPVLLLFTGFFLSETYDEQKAVKAQQNLILVELGKIKEKENNISSKVDNFKEGLQNQVTDNKELAQANSEQVLELWKELNTK